MSTSHHPFPAFEGNADNLRRLREQLATPAGVIPFVGAGLSMEFGIPGWTQFLTSLAEAADVKGQVNALLEKGEYEQAATLLEGELGEFTFRRKVEDAFGNHRLPATIDSGAVLHVPWLTAGPVITTNFDGLLEKAALEAGLPFREIIVGAKPDLIGCTAREWGRDLIKLHGRCNERTDRVLTSHDYDQHYGTNGVDFNLLLPKILHSLLQGKSFLFVGCSLAQDRTLAVLEAAASSDQLENIHFAIVERPSAEHEFAAKKRFLDQHHILPIWYPSGEHEWVERILGELPKLSPPPPPPPPPPPGYLLPLLVVLLLLVLTLATGVWQFMRRPALRRQPVAWSRFSSRDHAFSVMMPGKPSEAGSPLTVIAEDAGLRYSVLRWKTATVPSNPDHYLLDQETRITTAQAVEVRESPVLTAHAGRPALKLVGKQESNECAACLVLDTRWVYWLAVTGEHLDKRPAEVQRFLESFQLQFPPAGEHRLSARPR